MNKLNICIAASLALLAVAPGSAQAAAHRGDASIPFVGFGGIRNWTATDDSTVYLQASNDQWYEADLAGPCMGLPFAFGIGVDTRGSNTFDNFSSILVDGQRCPVTSVKKVTGPPARKAKAKSDQ